MGMERISTAEVDIRYLNYSQAVAYVTSGIQKAEAGAKVFHVDEINDTTYRRISIPDALYLNETLVNRYVLESEVFINVPIAKTHGRAGLTLSMKNLWASAETNAGSGTGSSMTRLQTSTAL
jgi:uncharacterized protein (DUF362 family)